MRQRAVTYLVKLARRMSIAAEKKGTGLPGQIVRKVDQNIL